MKRSSLARWLPVLLVGLSMMVTTAAAAQDDDAAAAEADDVGEAPPAPVDSPDEMAEEPAPEPAPADDPEDDYTGSVDRSGADDEMEEDRPRKRRKRRGSSRASRGDEDGGGGADTVGEPESDLLWLYVGIIATVWLPFGVCWSPWVAPWIAETITGEENWEYGAGSKVLACVGMIGASVPINIISIIAQVGIQFALSGILGAIAGPLGFVVGLLFSVITFATIPIVGAFIMDLMKDPVRRRGRDRRAEVEKMLHQKLEQQRAANLYRGQEAAGMQASMAF